MVRVRVLVRRGFVTNFSWRCDASHFHRVYEVLIAGDQLHQPANFRPVKESMKRLEFLDSGVDLVPDGISLKEGFAGQVGKPGVALSCQMRRQFGENVTE